MQQRRRAPTPETLRDERGPCSRFPSFTVAITVAAGFAVPT